MKNYIHSKENENLQLFKKVLCIVSTILNLKIKIFGSKLQI